MTYRKFKILKNRKCEKPYTTEKSPEKQFIPFISFIHKDSLSTNIVHCPFIQKRPEGMQSMSDWHGAGTLGAKYGGSAYGYIDPNL